MIATLRRWDVVKHADQLVTWGILLMGAWECVSHFYLLLTGVLDPARDAWLVNAGFLVITCGAVNVIRVRSPVPVPGLRALGAALGLVLAAEDFLLGAVLADPGSVTATMLVFLASVLFNLRPPSPPVAQ
jgi:hypothetical protein